MNLKIAMRALALAIDAEHNDAPMAQQQADLAKDLINALSSEDKDLLLQCICAAGADIVFN